MIHLLFIETSICVIYLVYALCTFFIYRGLKKESTIKKIQQYLPIVSIIVAAKDEEKNLPDCMASLEKLDYPKEKLDIILVNDRSTDKTGYLMQSHSLHAQYIEITQSSQKWTGKSNALIQGIHQSKGEFLFFTDADCIVPSTWIKSTLKKFDQGYDMVGGNLILDHSKWINSTFAKIQTLDWLFFTLMGSALTHRGLPVSIWGNNFAIRKSTYLNSGGLEKAGAHILEDFALLTQVARNRKNKIILSIDKTMAVKTQPAQNWIEFFHQRKRWAIGSRSHHRIIHSMALLTGLFYISIPVSMILNSFLISLTGILVLFCSDLLFLLYGCRKLDKLNLLKYYPLYKGFSLFYMLVFIPIFLFGKSAQWKDSQYKAKTNN